MELAGDCAGATKAGFYNSHGFAGIYNTTNGSVSEYVTFPTDPLQYPAPSASARQGQSGA